MASNYTSNYNLCQWEANDQVLRTEFNADNAKIDAALGSLASTVSGKASTSALNSLKTTVSGKADQSALNSLKTTVSQHTTALAGKGNCQVYTTSYVGSGKYGTAQHSSLTFPHRPMVVFITANNALMTLVRGAVSGWACDPTSSLYGCDVFWSGKAVEWFALDANSQMNAQGTTYAVVALLDAAN